MRYKLFLLVFLSTHYIVKAEFIENKGQVLNQFNKPNDEVLFIHQQEGLKVILRENGFSYELNNIVNKVDGFDDYLMNEYEDVSYTVKSHRIDFNFPSVPQSIEKFAPSKSYTNYYINGIEALHVQQFSKIIYKNVYPNVDVEFIISKEGKFKYNILCHNSADCASFYLTVLGGDDVKITTEDALGITTSLGYFEEKIPYSYLLDTNQKLEKVDVTYLLTNDSIFFRTPQFNANTILVIDPEPEGVWGTYFGGAEYDISTTIATDFNANVYHAGITMSFSNIATTGAHEASYQGGLDGFIAKYDTEGNLLWSSYYGGPQTDRPYGLTTDSQGNVYLGGSSHSEFGIATIGSYQDVLSGMDDIFIVKFNENGVRQWSTYVGGTGHDFVTTIKHSNTTLYITGHTNSPNGISTAGTFLPNYTANETGYLMSLSDDGTTRNWGTYIGSENGSSGEGLAVFDNAIVVGGRTTSTSGISSLGSHQPTLNGFGNAFVQRFNNDGTLVWGTYYGGTFTDKIKGIATDSDNNIYAAGDASSLVGIATPDAYQPSRLSSEQGFLVKFDENGVRQWGTYLGGSSTDYITSIDFSDSVIVVAGKTLSASYIASMGAYKDTLTGGYDGFFCGFNTNGAYLWGTYYGGEQDENIAGICFDVNGNIYASGAVTGSLNGIAFGNAEQNTFGGASNDGFIFKLCRAKPVSVVYQNGWLIANGADHYEWFMDNISIGLFSDSIQPQNDGVYSVIGSSDGSCAVFSNEYIHSTIGLETNNIAYELFPNPINRQQTLTIKALKEIQSIEILTLTGQILVEEEFPTTPLGISLSSFRSGVYIVRILTIEGYSENKLVVY